MGKRKMLETCVENVPMIAKVAKLPEQAKLWDHMLLILGGRLCWD